jgi:hypothetical protein
VWPWRCWSQARRSTCNRSWARSWPSASPREPSCSSPRRAGQRHRRSRPASRPPGAGGSVFEPR